MERFKKEVIASPCFDEVRKSRPDFNEFISSKIVPIEGDLVPHCFIVKIKPWLVERRP